VSDVPRAQLPRVNSAAVEIKSAKTPTYFRIMQSSWTERPDTRAAAAGMPKL
jgi:hypothetical protein